MHGVIRRTLVFNMVTLAFVPLAKACSCADPGRPCRAVAETAVVFAGQVTSLGQIAIDDSGYRYVRAAFKVHQKFKGRLPRDLDDTIEVLTGQGGGDCGFAFRVGRAYLVYADVMKEGNRLYAGICTRTRALADAAEDLAYLRSRDDPRRGAGIEGQIERLKRHRNGDTEWSGWMSGVHVTVHNADGKHETRTDSQGLFRVWGLLPGTYTVTAALPAGFVGGTIEEVQTRADRCGEARILATPEWKPPPKAPRPSS